MRVVTTTNLATKYKLSQDEVTSLLKTLSSDVDILEKSDYANVKAHIDSINDEILLVGGHDVVPFAIIPNPCNDSDQFLYSDAPYACTEDPLFYLPNKVVGRLPDENDTPHVDYLRTVVANQVHHMTNGNDAKGWFNLVASVWVGIATFMKQTFNMEYEGVVPPVLVNSIPDTAVLNKKFHYLNLHGSQQTSYYYGQNAGNYPIALAPKAGYFKDGIVVTEACYGAYLIGRKRDTSIPLMALLSGAKTVVGSTAIAYGPAMPPVDGADLLSQCFFKHVLAGETVGQAFLNAKKDFATTLLQRDGNIVPSNKKTLLEFVLLGVPSLKA